MNQLNTWTLRLQDQDYRRVAKGAYRRRKRNFYRYNTKQVAGLIDRDVSTIHKYYLHLFYRDGRRWYISKDDAARLVLDMLAKNVKASHPLVVDKG
jgi:hypothetical protein